VAGFNYLKNNPPFASLAARIADAFDSIIPE
jgi:hypothetical protein